MAKVMIWPDLYREQGHWLPAVNLAKSLKDASHAVEFMGIPDCASIVAPYKATFREILADIYPRGHTVNDRLEPIGQRWKPHHLLPLCRGALDSIFTGSGKPDVLVAGYFSGLEALILHHKYDVPIVILTTYLRHPDDDPAIFAKGKLIHMPEAVAQKIMDLAMGTTSADLEEFLAPLDDAKELIPCPREFDFYDEDWDHARSRKLRGKQPTTFYVEPMITRATLDGSPLQISVPDIPAGKKVISGTSGSQVTDYEDKARQFFKNLIGMMKTPGMENHHLVLAIGDKLLAEFKVLYGIDKGTSSLPSNVSLTAWVSQLEILTDAEAVFMHGGLATIKESIWEQVPIIIFPHGKDQMDNALRIERAGVGVTPRMNETSPQALRQLLTQVRSSSWIKKRLKENHDLFEAKENQNPKPSVGYINAALT